MRVLRKGQKCEYEDCNEPAEFPAKGRTEHPNVGVYCTVHSMMVADEDWPEYMVDCPNCGCGFGVN